MDWRRRAQALASGLDVSQPWRAAFAATPRHVFVPRFFDNQPGRGWCAVDETDPEFFDRVYSTEALITQLDGDSESWEKTRRDGVYYGGHATSSSSSLVLMADMLDALDVNPGMDVLEIGTGTGYNAALLCHRLGDDHVTSVDVDGQLIELAAQRLASVGYRPRLVSANALVELPEGRYDRIITTVGIGHVPPRWLSVVKPGGLMLLNLYSDLAAHAIFALTVHGDGTASGRAPVGGSFMPTRDNIMPFNFTLYKEDIGQQAPTGLPGRMIGEFGPFCLFLSFIMRDVQLYQFSVNGEFLPGLLGRDGSWAYEDNGTAVHSGHRDLWAEAETVHELWQAHGCPDHDRLGLTVTDSQQSLWVDSPDRVVHVEVSAVSTQAGDT